MEEKQQQQQQQDMEVVEEEEEMAALTTTTTKKNNMATATTTTTRAAAASSSSPSDQSTAPKFCFNSKCSTSSSPSWKPGWLLLRSGRIADLCEPCGLAYERLCFCETFHADDTGWRTCSSCQKRVHCGCIASIFAYIHLDGGGIECVRCSKRNNISYVKAEDSPVEGWTQDVRAKISWNPESGCFLPLAAPWLAPAGQVGATHWQAVSEIERRDESGHAAGNSTGERTSAADSHIKAEDDTNNVLKDHNAAQENAMSAQPAILDSINKERKTNVMNKNRTFEENMQCLLNPVSSKEGRLKGEFLTREVDGGASLDTGGQSWRATTAEELGDLFDFTDSNGLVSGNSQFEISSTACTTLPFALYPPKGVASETNEPTGPKVLLSKCEANGDGRNLSKFSASTAVAQRQKQLCVRPPPVPASSRAETPKDSLLQIPIRIARPPAEGRGRNQLLPRYWPRITDQELQQISSGDSNSTITPLFEKMLSASDAGRIGRLVLPKACAEAYFPAISQPEGVPLKIQDVTGKDWSFQFRFWPNNNSRMYVLEGVTPCIQSMQLQAGDTVTFSRLDPEGKLIMGYRRAPNLLSSQDSQNVTVSTSTTTPTMTSMPMGSGGMDSLNNLAPLCGLTANAVKASLEAQANCIVGSFDVSDTGYGWQKAEKQAKRPKDSSIAQSANSSERKRGRHLGQKIKRPRLEVEESVDNLDISWEEVHELLRPPPNVVPSILMIDGHEFEEYEEPPVFGKRTLFLPRKGRPGDDHWAQCDDCGSWRRVPPDVFLPVRWTCDDNVWDSKRNTCIAPQEQENEEVDSVSCYRKETPSGLEALANAATLGENKVSPAPTTKHPRHRPGCTCIVCIQPPSGKGPKHKPTCTCNVCVTVKRRFKTLMLRRKKKQSERESEGARKKRVGIKDEGDVNSGTKSHSETHSISEHGMLKGNFTATFPPAIPKMNHCPSSGNGFSPNVTLTAAYPSQAKCVGEELVIEKAAIDLNSQPERDDEPCKDASRVTMMMLFQTANYPLERYLQQQGLSNLSCSTQLMNPAMPFSGNLGSVVMDGDTSSQYAVLTSNKPSDDQSLGFAQDKLGSTTVFTQTGCLQNLDLLEQNSALQVSSQSS